MSQSEQSKLVRIQNIPIHHITHLHRLFSDALVSDFGYFSENYRQTVLSSNNLLKMYMGAINPSRLYTGLYYNNKLTGYSLSSVQPAGQGFLYWLFVSPELRHKKLGKQLLDTTENNLRTKGVDSISLVTHNQQQFYERQDYVLEKILSEVVADVDMYVMKKQLV